ncbi:DUF6019 family protein [Proteiniclasticum sp.]|uniref:DUF6019 family protein n=1 Tax=Proteiniclasticum sp. TaxID=2053595 RepID=UPI002897D8E5|nr:DUF6019 family protein [Proteiniclasticum sp.]
MEGLAAVFTFIIPAAALFLIILYAVKFAILEAHREINEKKIEPAEKPDSQ